jgi:RNase adaptor protein for sRNA GlmZ degradation
MRLVIVTGMSGAGRATALKILEDAGYFCVDNLPVPFVDKFAELTASGNSEITKVAIGLDIRSGKALGQMEQILERMVIQGIPYEILFLDEPTSGVDVRTRRDFWKHISALTTAGASVLVTTHFMEEAEYCDRIALIYRGSMITTGSPDDLKASVKGVADPTLEDAFIAHIEKYDREHPL